MTPVTLWQSESSVEGCSLSTEGEFGSVILHFEGDGNEFELVMDCADARKFIYEVHRAIMESLSDDTTNSPTSQVGGNR